MEKARSRLTTTPTLTKTPHLPKIVINTRYLRAAPIGLLGLLGLGALAFFLKNITPESVVDVPLYHSYGPFLLLFLTTSTLLLGFVLLNIRRGFLLASALTLLLLLKFQQVQITWIIVLIILGTPLIIEFFTTFIHRVIKKT